MVAIDTARQTHKEPIKVKGRCERSYRADLALLPLLDFNRSENVFVLPFPAIAFHWLILVILVLLHDGGLQT
jgi:hypothetical protein